MTHALTLHLWQSTFFALAAGLLTIAFRRNRAQVRYWLWLSASLKFFIPFALLLNLGSRIETFVPAARQIATPTVSYMMEQVSEPFIPQSPPSPDPAPDSIHWIPIASLAAWFCGFATVALIRFRNWIRIRAAVGASTATNISTTVEIRVSPGLLEPGVVGLMRPILLLPEGIAEHLTPSELNAVLAHELCHIRRRDNLFATLHMVVEGIFWFHPLVWWIGARLVEERERACDEEVLSLGNRPDVYADAILNVCKLYVESPLCCVSGVSGAGIRRRIEAIMINRRVPGLNRAKKVLLASAGALALAGPVAIGLITGVGNVPAIRAQSSAASVAQIDTAPIQLSQAQTAPVRTNASAPRPAPTPKFEVAAIRLCNPNDSTGVARSGTGGSASAPTPGRLTINCESTEALIWYAYDLYANGPRPQGNDVRTHLLPPIEGAPSWTKSERYRIDAKPEGQASLDLMRGPMLQNLLEDRFQLKLHRQPHEVPAYALTVAKGGPKLTPFPDGGCWHAGEQPDPGRPLCGMNKPEMAKKGRGPGAPLLWDVPGLDASGIAKMLQRYLNRPVVDRTGITGMFEVRMEFAWDESITPFITRDCSPDCGPLTGPDPNGTPSIFTAVQQQLGLKLEPTKSSADTLVIDHVERPTEN